MKNKQYIDFWKLMSLKTIDFFESKRIVMFNT